MAEVWCVWVKEGYSHFGSTISGEVMVVVCPLALLKFDQDIIGEAYKRQIKNRKGDIKSKGTL